MDSRRLLTYRAVAHERSFSRAAEQLALTQPAVSQQVAGLEREVGCRLLERRAGGLRLTRAGQVLLEHADAIADRLALAGAQLSEVAQSERAMLRIGAFPTALATLVPAAVDKLRAQRPELIVSVDEGGTGELAARVRLGELHLAVAFQDAAAPPLEHQDLERRELLREAFLVAVSPEHPLAKRRRRVSLADFAGDGWTVALPDGLIVRACRAAGFEPRLVSLTRDQLAIHALISRGLAVSLVPRLLSEAFHGLALLEISGEAPERDIYALLPAGARHPLADDAVAALAAVTDRLRAAHA